MINPFEVIVSPDVGDFEEIEGALDCQTCGVTVHEGKYFDAERLLVWQCPDGHKSMIEGFHID